MKPKTLVLLAVAGGCGLLAMLGVQQAMQNRETTAPVETAKVAIALENIETGMRLTPDNVTFEERPIHSLPEDPVRTEEEYADRAARVPLMAGDVVRMTKLTEKGAYGKSVEIPKGMRVYTINVDDTHTSSGLVSAGDRVDVMVTYQAVSPRGPVAETKPLLEYVEVFATGDKTASRVGENKDSNRVQYVSLLLTPEQVPFVVMAQRKGTLSLVWRNRADDEIVQTKGIDEKLLEELKGSVGIHDSNVPLYGRRYGGDFADTDDSDSSTTDTKQDTKPVSQFLNDTMDNSASQPTVTNLPPAPMWTVQVYEGNEPVEKQFEIDETPKNIESAVQGLLKSFWGSNGSSSGKKSNSQPTSVMDIH